MNVREELPVLRSLHDLGTLVERVPHLYVRWSNGPDADRKVARSTDELTGVRMPGLSANPLDVEDWWEDRPIDLWVARRLYDYSHLHHEKGAGVRPWVLRGRVEGHGPDNEPLVRDVEPVGWIDEAVIEEARAAVAEQERSWGTMRRGD
ncbi:DUF6098 family protein [Streptomyces sp. ME02-8801-2C]|uniref:DUF6098 family protein n=1 Tax=Streptomyces sp. ME02-8801-2C TaxID=3028680 RepID=UPI0029AF3A7A|nr:DUF6098 family protein [Streptomyces sp. ME02-8801-2C]MDX3457998.1 DUF6098 family protein [Streptomyces sp. ME02-8801-2C]